MADRSTTYQQTPLGRLIVTLAINILMFVGVLGGLVLAAQGFDELIFSDGQDLAIPGEEVHQLTIESTRDVFISSAGARDLILGFGLIVGTLWAVSAIKTYFTPSALDHEHSEPEQA